MKIKLLQTIPTYNGFILKHDLQYAKNYFFIKNVLVKRVLTNICMQCLSNYVSACSRLYAFRIVSIQDHVNSGFVSIEMASI